MNKIFRQYFDAKSSTYTYLLGDLKNKVAIIIDTVYEQVERDLSTIQEFDFEKVYLVNTHIHADHITGNSNIKSRLTGTSVRSVISRFYEGAKADIFVDDNEKLSLGAINLEFVHTPGHTAGCMCIIDSQDGRVFTGDTLLIRGCGRTDFQGGNSESLYESVHKKLFTLPKSYTVYPAHDYKGCTASSIGEEILFNKRLTKPKQEFIEIMANLNLAYPKMMDIAVPANLRCGFHET